MLLLSSTLFSAEYIVQTSCNRCIIALKVSRLSLFSISLVNMAEVSRPRPSVNSSMAFSSLFSRKKKKIEDIEKIYDGFR